MDTNDEQVKARADQAADGFRNLCAGLAGALIILSVDLLRVEADTGNKTTPDFIFGGQLAGLAALYVLGLSWTLQKSKSLAARDRRERTSLILTNQVYDTVAFAAILFALTWLVFGAYKQEHAALVASAVSSSFFFVIALLDFIVDRKSCRPVPQQSAPEQSISHLAATSSAGEVQRASAASDWDARQRSFWLEATPEVFRWAGWTAALSGLLYIAKKSGDVSAWITSLGLSVAILMYLEAAFIKHLPPLFGGLRDARSRRAITVAAGTLITIGTYTLALHLANLLAAK